MANPPEGWKYHSGAGRRQAPEQPGRPVRRAPAKRAAPRRSSLEARYAPQAQKRQVRRPQQQPTRRAPSGQPAPRRAAPARRRRRGSLLPWGLAALISCLILGFTFVWSTQHALPAGADASGALNEGEPAPAVQDLGECVFRCGGDALPQEVQDTLTEWFVRCYNASARLEAPPAGRSVRPKRRRPGSLSAG